MPATPNVMPGVQGKDYRYVSYGGQLYVVYSVAVSKGMQITVGWRLTAQDQKDLGVDSKKAQSITASQFQNLQVFGTASEITRGGSDVHPWKKFLNDIEETYGHASWLHDREYMQVFMMGWFEQTDPQVLAQRLQQTSWYQSRTEAQISWEGKSKAQQAALTKSATGQIKDALEQLYGVSMDYSKYVTPDQIGNWAKQIASGKLGDPSTGFQSWFDRQRHQAEQVEGSQAWIDREQKVEAQRAFTNRPEDMFQQIKSQALQWLGPSGLPSDHTLRQWADNLVTAKSSDGDWQQFLQGRAKQLYPYLGQNEPWQDFADPYKRLVEDTWGQPIDWSNPILSGLGAVDANGKPTGAAMPFQDFTQMVRSRPEFWAGPVARQEGSDLIAQLANTFEGVT